MSLPPFPKVNNIQSPIARVWFEKARAFINSSVTVVSSPTANNFAALNAEGEIEDSGYDQTSFVPAADGTPNAVIADTSGRNLRQIRVLIEDGTNANTLKVTVTSLFNGDAIAVTDNIAKGATIGNFSLDAAGEVLTIEASGLSGNVVMAQGALQSDTSNTADPTLECKVASNDITLQVESNGVNEDLTGLTDVGGFSGIIAHILYLTDA